MCDKKNAKYVLILSGLNDIDEDDKFFYFENRKEANEYVECELGARTDFFNYTIVCIDKKKSSCYNSGDLNKSKFQVNENKGGC